VINVPDRPIFCGGSAIEDDLSTKSVAREHWSWPTVQLYRISTAKQLPPAIAIGLAIALSKDPGGIRVMGLRSRIPFATLIHRRVRPAGCVSRAASKARFSRFDAAALISVGSRYSMPCEHLSGGGSLQLDRHPEGKKTGRSEGPESLRYITVHKQPFELLELKACVARSMATRARPKYAGKPPRGLSCHHPRWCFAPVRRHILQVTAALTRYPDLSDVFSSQIRVLPYPAHPFLSGTLESFQ